MNDNHDNTVDNTEIYSIIKRTSEKQIQLSRDNRKGAHHRHYDDSDHYDD